MTVKGKTPAKKAVSHQPSAWQQRQAQEKAMERHIFKPLRNQVRRMFNRADMKRVCEMSEYDFDEHFDLTFHVDEDRKRNNFYYYKDNGSNILAVAHLDTVVRSWERRTEFCETADGPICHSGALDDRLGAYIILCLLPLLGINVDVLLTVGEEQGESTAELFDPPEGKQYNWMIEFDRKKNDVVMYEYDSPSTKDLVRACGATVGHGSFSDICYLNHLGIKGFNWGTGYDGVYHSTRGFVYLMDTYEMVAYFMVFYEQNKDTYLQHTRKSWVKGRRGGIYGEPPKAPTPQYGGSHGAYGRGGVGRSGSAQRSNGRGGTSTDTSSTTYGYGHGRRKTWVGGVEVTQVWILGVGWKDCDQFGEPLEESAGLADEPTADHRVWNDEHGWVVMDRDDNEAYHSTYKPGTRQRYVQGYGWIDLDDKGEPVKQAMVSMLQSLDDWSTKPVMVGGVRWPSYMEWWNYTHPDEPVDEQGNPLPARDTPDPDDEALFGEIDGTLPGIEEYEESLFSHRRTDY